MDRRFSKESSKVVKPSATATSLHKQMAENRRPSKPVLKPAEPVPDVADLMDEWFFGGSNISRKQDSKSSNTNNSSLLKIITNGGGGGVFMDSDDDGDKDKRVSSTTTTSRSKNSRLTQEWLEEAKLMVASSPRCDSPSRLTGSPRFGSTGQKELDRRDPLSRSARRHRAVETFSGEILSKHSRNRSETFESKEDSPASVVHQWFSNILKHTNNNNNTPSEDDPPAKPPIPVVRKSRFRDIPSQTQALDTPARRTFKNTPSFPSDTEVLSPPKNLIESAHRRSVSSSTCSILEKQILSPPKNLIQSAHRRSVSSSTCSTDKASVRTAADAALNRKSVGDNGARDLNGFLKEQKFKIGRLSHGDINAKARIILSGSSNSTSSMVAAICYAWLLDNRIKNNKEENSVGVTVVAPVMNMKRRTMWKQRQAAWLFHHVGIDASALLFADEVDLESLMLNKQLSLLVVGQDVLKTNSEVESQCTILTDHYCEDAYDLLQIPILKKLLLAGIMLDTQNLNSAGSFYTNRDAEAVQLLLVGSSPNYRNSLFDQLIQDQRDSSFMEALRCNYGKLTNESDDRETMEHNVVAGRVSTSINNQAIMAQALDKINQNEAKNVLKAKKSSPKPAPAPVAESTPARTPENRGKNKFSLAKWFGFGSK